MPGEASLENDSPSLAQVLFSHAFNQVVTLDFSCPADSPASYMQDDAFWERYMQSCWKVSTHASSFSWACELAHRL